MARRLGVTVDPARRGGLHRHQGAGGRASRSGSACAAPTATPCSTRRSATRPTRWARRSPAAGRCPTASLDDITDADAARALCLWVNVPGNPTGALGDLGAAAAWGRARGVPGAVRRVLRRVHLGRPAAHDPRARHRRRARRALAVEALQPRRRAGRVLRRRRATSCTTCREVRKHVGPHGARPGAGGRGRGVGRRRARRRAARALPSPPRGVVGAPAPASASTRRCPAGAFYLWAPAPDGDAWALTRAARHEAGALVSPASSTVRTAPAFVRVAVVQPDDRIALVADRLRRRRRLRRSGLEPGPRPRGPPRRSRRARLALTHGLLTDDAASRSWSPVTTGRSARPSVDG